MSRYYNPANDIPRLARPLQGGSFQDLSRQLQGTEVLIGYFQNQVPAPVATHVDSEKRQEEIEKAWTGIAYYGFPKSDANKGMRPEIP